VIIDKTYIKNSVAEVLSAINSISINVKTACTCIDDYGIADPACELCDGLGYTIRDTTISADVQELRGDERIVVDSGILNAGDIIVRIPISNSVELNDIITYNSQNYEIKYIKIDQLGTYYEVGGHKIA
jgi:hypothetical protein